MTPQEIEPALLADILRGAYVPLAPPVDAPARLACELAGDAALVQRQYEDALQAYKAARGSSWRLRSKMGLCCYQLDQWAAAARYLQDAPRRGEAPAMGMLIHSLAEQNGRTGEYDEQLDALVRTLLELPEPQPYFYELADSYLIDGRMRLQHLRKGYERFPGHADLRRRYTRALWAAEHREEDLLALVHEAIDADKAAPEDLWQGAEIMQHVGRHGEALALLRRLDAVSAPETQRALALVEADMHLRAGELDSAACAFRNFLGRIDLGDGEVREMAMHAAKGLLQVTLTQNDSNAIEAAADSVASIHCHYGIMALVDQNSPIDPSYFRFTVGVHIISYSPLTDLTSLQERIIGAIADADVRALFRVFYGAHEGPYATISPEDASAQIMAAGRESKSPYIQYHVAWTMMEAGEFEEAGRAFARFDLARANEAPATWSTYSDDTIFDDAPFNDETVVDQFARGMSDELLGAAKASEEWLGEHLYEIGATYLRAPLLHYQLYTRHHSLMEGIVAVYRAAGANPTETVWFDYGLACYFTSRPDEAIAAYQACLAQNPKHSAAHSNLLALLPAPARTAAVIDQAIRSFGEASPPDSIAELSLKQAVYLLALYRACGGAEQDLVLLPFGLTEQPFSPTPELLQPLFSLLRAGLVRISRQSPPEAFTIEPSPARVTAYSPPLLYWELAAETLDRIREIEDACLTRRWPAAWREQAPDLAHELARHECVAYLRHLAEERGLPMTTGEKTFLMIDNALATYSVGQTYAFCWQGAKAAVDFRARKSVSALHAANTIVGSCQRSIDVARTKQWAVENYTRPSQVRRSHLSYVLYDAFLGFGDRAFTTPLAQLFEEARAGQQREMAP